MKQSKLPASIGGHSTATSLMEDISLDETSSKAHKKKNILAKIMGNCFPYRCFHVNRVLDVDRVLKDEQLRQLRQQMTGNKTNHAALANRTMLIETDLYARVRNLENRVSLLDDEMAESQTRDWEFH